MQYLSPRVLSFAISATQNAQRNKQPLFASRTKLVLAYIIPVSISCSTILWKTTAQAPCCA